MGLMQRLGVVPAQEARCVKRLFTHHDPNRPHTIDQRQEEAMSTNELNQAKSEAFAEKMVGVLNNASIALMTSIGHQTGLFDTMADLPSSTSEQIALAAS